MQHTKFRLSLIAAAVAAIFGPQAHAAGAGSVEFVTNGVNAVGANGQSRPLAKGAELQPGEIIDTGNGRAQLRFTDGGIVSLQPQTQFRLETYGYDRNDSSKNSIVMNLLKGGLRTITGLIGKTNREGYKLQTSTATVGIRGTEFSITGFPDGSILFHVADGSIDVSNRGGSSTLTGGQSTLISNNTSTPTKVDEKPFLPPAGPAVFNIPAPTNAVQDATPVTQPLLVGTFKGQWATTTASAMEGNQVPNGNGIFTVDAAGKLFSYGDDGAEGGPRTASLGGANSQSYGNDGVMAWGRWIGSANGLQGPRDYSTDPLHYVVGLPLTVPPTTGVATYKLYGGTAPSMSACSGNACGSKGTSVASSFQIDFANYRGLFNLTVTNNNDGISLSTQAGGAPLNVNSNTSGITFNTSTSLTQTAGVNTVSNATANVNGFLAGPGASHAGAVYGVNYSTYEGTGANINGALVYKSGGVAPGSLPPPAGPAARPAL